MATNEVKLLIMLVFSSMISLNSSCKKHFGCAENVYSFEIGVRAYPDKDSITVGDTVWFEVSESVSLKDEIANKQINYSGAENLGSVVSILKLSPNNTFTIKSAGNFHFILNKGSERNALDPSFEKQYIFVEENNRYLFKLGIVPKDKGTYGIIFSSAANVYRKSDRCTKASFAINFKETNQHYPLNPNFQGGPTPVGGDYYFKVN